MKRIVIDEIALEVPSGLSEQEVRAVVADSVTAVIEGGGNLGSAANLQLTVDLAPGEMLTTEHLTRELQRVLRNGGRP